jgi:2-keto-3-deoxy-L-rhamnonate aldolase RhmA
VPWPEEWMIKRALDAGAHGIMTPMCHSAVRTTPAHGFVLISRFPRNYV